jgi:hypothetical protein
VPLDGNAVFVDLPIKRLAQCDEVSPFFSRSGRFLSSRIEPEPHPVEKVKPTPVDHVISGGLFLRAEENGCGEDSLETFNNAVIMVSIRRQVEESEHLGSGSESDGAALLPQGQGGDPYGNEPVLAEGQSELRMADDVEKKFAAVPQMSELFAGWPAEWNAAKNKGSSIECEVLLPSLALFADKHDSLEFFQAALCDADGGKERAD